MKTFRFFGVKNKIKRVWKTITDLFNDYSNHSTVHGINYFAEKGRPFERVWWICVIIFSVFCCTTLISNAWNTNPIIISFVEKPTPIWQIPFPAVTICPKNFIQSKYLSLESISSKLVNYYHLSLPKKRIQQLVALSMLCPEPIVGTFQDLQFEECNDCVESLRDIKIPFDEMFVECQFRNEFVNCSEIFEEVVLNGSLCYTFNGLDVYRRANESENEVISDWRIDEGYKSTATLDAYPQRAVGAGTQLGLSVWLTIDKWDIDYTCSKNPGFKVEYRMPFETPQLISSYFDLPLKHSMVSTLKPKMMATSDQLQSYPVSVRNCYFSHEHPLKYFHQYTQSNCETECLADLMLNRCKCLPIYIKNRHNESACVDKDCVDYFNLHFYFWTEFPCNCLPACSSLSFDTETSISKLNTSSWYNRYEYSHLIVYFKDNEFTASQRSELYGQTDFLANCGGFLGLFLGVSILSIVEILYFSTVRMFFYIKDSNTNKDTTFVETFPNNHVQAGSKGYLKVVKNVIADYSAKTTIQGINYVTDNERSWIERVWWTIAIVMSVVCCGFLIFDVFDRYEQSPIIVSYENEEMMATEIPFPAVTICPQILSKDISSMYKSFRNQNRSLYTFNINDIAIVTAVAQFCDPEVFQDLDPRNQTHCDSCFDTLKYITGDNMNIVLKRCKHQFQRLKCSLMFKEVVTEDGLCYTYNSLEFYKYSTRTVRDAKTIQFTNWTLDDGYAEHGNVTLSKFYPRPGSKLPFMIDLEALRILIDGKCKGQLQGFKVFLHLPNEAPQTSKFYYLVPYEHSVQILISPKVTIASPELREYAIEKRQCYFNDERYLRFFRYYTQSNCELECVANLTISKCGCLRFHMPRLPGIKYCGISDIRCYQAVLRESAESNMTSECNCLTTCNSIVYDTEINQVYWTDESIELYFRDFRDDLMRVDHVKYLKKIRFSKLLIVFKENQYIVSKRSQLYGVTELIANCGGLLGLFLGFSIVSVLEFLYFCTIRLLFDVLKQN